VRLRSRHPRETAGARAQPRYQRNYSSPHDNRQLKIRTQRAAGAGACSARALDPFCPEIL
jgi:hypothetical protein